MNETYWKVAAMLVVQKELHNKRSEGTPETDPEVKPVRASIRFVVRKFGTLLVLVGSRLAHIGYPHMSSTQL